MSDQQNNLDNPLNHRDDREERNQPHVIVIPPEAEADDLFDDSLAPPEPNPAENRPNADETSALL